MVQHKVSLPSRTVPVCATYKIFIPPMVFVVFQFFVILVVVFKAGIQKVSGVAKDLRMYVSRLCLSSVKKFDYRISNISKIH